VLQPRQRKKARMGHQAKEARHVQHRKPAPVSVIGIDIGKNSFHAVGQDQRGAIVLRQKWSRGQAEARLANVCTPVSRREFIMLGVCQSRQRSPIHSILSPINQY
jgi:hypothetical protein